MLWNVSFNLSGHPNLDNILNEKKNTFILDDQIHMIRPDMNIIKTGIEHKNKRLIEILICAHFCPVNGQFKHNLMTFNTKQPGNQVKHAGTSLNK